MRTPFTSLRLLREEILDESSLPSVCSSEGAVTNLEPLRTSSSPSASPPEESILSGSSENVDNYETEHQSHLRRFVAGLYNATRRLNVRLYGESSRRLTLESRGHAERPRTAEPFYETAMPRIHSSISSRLHLTRNFLTSWNPVRVRRDTQRDHQRSLNRVRNLFRRAVSRRTITRGYRGSYAFSDTDIDDFADIDSGTESGFIDASPTNSVDQENNNRDAFQRAVTASAEVDGDQSPSRQDWNAVEAPRLNISRSHTFSRIVRFSFHRTRPSARTTAMTRQYAFPTPVSPQVKIEDPSTTEPIATTSTDSTFRNPVQFRRRTFRYGLGRNRELYEILGSFDDFYTDPLLDVQSEGCDK